MLKKRVGKGKCIGLVCILTGPPGVGKSSIAKELAGKFEKAGWIDVDFLRKMVVSGYAKPGDKTDEAALQATISVQNACTVAKNFAEKGFTVFIDDIVATPKRLDLYKKGLSPLNFKTFLLMADRKTVRKRDSQRPAGQVMGKRAMELYTIFSKIDNKKWKKIDTTGKTIKETADAILKKT